LQDTTLNVTMSIKWIVILVDGNTLDSGFDKKKDAVAAPKQEPKNSSNSSIPYDFICCKGKIANFEYLVIGNIMAHQEPREV